MKATNLSIEGLKLISLDRFEDQRGCFFESYNEDKFNKAVGAKVKFVQDNVSSSSFDILRGLHYQLAPKSQAKFVQVLKGRVLDVAVDLRPDSKTFLKWESVELTDKNGLAFYIPPGFAHGFRVLSIEAVFMYKVTEYYTPEFDRAVNWEDPAFGIDWGKGQPNLSEKDYDAPPFEECKEEILSSYYLTKSQKNVSYH
jgi:dTDP-4-dehydrorhamnose 3,5-epimerase